jgi:hypothetical protein
MNFWSVLIEKVLDNNKYYENKDICLNLKEEPDKVA